MDLETAAALWAGGNLRCDELPVAAVDALMAGLDSPALRILAGETEPHWSEADMLFRRALDELGIPFPTPPQLVLRTAKHYANKVLQSSTSLFSLAYEVWMAFQEEKDAPEVVRQFISQASDYYEAYDMEWAGLGYFKTVQEAKDDFLQAAQRVLQTIP